MNAGNYRVTFRKLHIVLLASWLLPAIAAAQVKLDGYILDATKHTPLTDARVSLYIFERDSLVTLDSNAYNFGAYTYRDSIYRRQDRCMVDSAGYYSFTISSGGVYKLIAESQLKRMTRGTYYEVFETKICVVSSMQATQSNNIYLAVYCPFDDTRQLKACPVCHQEDKVRVYVWGLPSTPSTDSQWDSKKFIITGDCSPPRCRPERNCGRCGRDF